MDLNHTLACYERISPSVVFTTEITVIYLENKYLLILVEYNIIIE